MVPPHPNPLPQGERERLKIQFFDRLGVRKNVKKIMCL
jgi:hypothetical protein